MENGKTTFIKMWKNMLDRDEEIFNDERLHALALKYKVFALFDDI